MKNGKLILKFLLIAILFVPLSQEVFRFVKEKPLDGSIEKVRNRKFIWKNWWKGSYQQGKEKFIDVHFGFYKSFIRINNQIFFSLFNIAKANQVIIGKENYLYESNYIKAYYGTDFIGTDSIEKQTNKLKSIQDYLDKKNKTLLLFFAPGKATFYNMFIPEKFHTSIVNTNWNSYTKSCKQKNINHIDFNSYYLQLKDTTSFALFPKYGIHWSQYGMYLAMDSMLSYIETTRHSKIPKRIITTSQISSTYFENENDIEKGMNLLFNLKNKQRFLHQDFKWQIDSNLTKPKVMVIADSYFWQMMRTDIMTKAFDGGEFWFYFKEINSNILSAAQIPQDLNLKDTFEKFDAIILLSTDANLSRLGWGFIDKAAADIANTGL